MRASIIWINGLALVAALFLGSAHQHRRAMQRAAMYNARLFLEHAYADYERTGSLPASQPHARLTLFTNLVAVPGGNVRCAL